MRAERRAGQLLAEMEKAKGTVLNGRAAGGAPLRQSQRATAEATTLADLGISKTQSSRWQKLAAVPEAEFEATFATPAGTRRDMPSTGGILARGSWQHRRRKSRHLLRAAITPERPERRSRSPA